MLALSRKIHETIVIDEGTITIHVVRIFGDQVRLAIEAPKEIRIDRGEVHRERMKAKENPH